MRSRLRRDRVALLALLLLVVGLAGWYVRDTQHALDELRREVRADCAFKRDVSRIADEVQTAGPVTATLSWDAWDAYVAKGCAAELGRLHAPSRPRPAPAG